MSTRAIASPAASTLSANMGALQNLFSAAGAPAELQQIISDADEPSTLDNALQPPLAAAENSFSFDSQLAAHDAALQNGIHGAGGDTPSVTVAGAASPLIGQGGGPQREGESDWNYNMRAFGGGFKPQAYDPTSLQNVNDDPLYQAARVSADKRSGIFEPIGYDPSSLQHINDSLSTQAVLQGASQPRRDMRYQFMPESDPNQNALPSPVTAPSDLTNRKKKPVFQSQLSY